MKYRKKPVVIEAMQFTNETKDQCHTFVTCTKRPSYESGEPILIIQTLEGDMVTRFGDWIIKGVKGEFYPCKNDIFEKTYEPADYRQTEAGKRRFENPEVYKKTLEFQMYLQSQGVAWHNIFADECTNDFCCCTGEGEYKTYFPSNQSRY